MIICISGLASSGKSLLAKNLKIKLESEGNKVFHCNSDIIAKKILDHKYDFNNNDFDYSQEDLLTIYKTMYTMFEDILALNPNAIIITDGMYRKASQRLMLKLIAVKLNIDFKLIYIDVNPTTAKKRITKRIKQGGHGGWVDPSEYEFYFGKDVVKLNNNGSKDLLLRYVNCFV